MKTFKLFLLLILTSTLFAVQNQQVITNQDFGMQVKSLETEVQTEIDHSVTVNSRDNRLSMLWQT